ncbi:MAG: DUF4349 domain-containing protein [Acidimicrobiaceae bacterium]|nr:DUF4349 domain-containing protein [Acidimicrobiaceae bacterium]MYB87539.1 DUF4349 domain-containing protein [Acidimicrobiaceae bacterium]MYH93579.1 DUF4349 domain-containing protein [Acidimicrobiaceae bacterium]
MHDAINLHVRTPRPSLKILALALLGAVLVLLSACTGDDGDESAASADAPADELWQTAVTEAEPEAEEAPAPTTPPQPDAEAALAVPTALTPADLGREIVYRATIGVQADDVTAASNEAVAIVQGLGGIVFSQTTRTEPEPWAEMVFKVLPGDFSTALERLAGVGKLVDQSISADDVTERVVDLESRISTAETSVARLRRLLEEAVDLEDVAAIERQLLDRETTLEVLRGQLRTLRDQVDLATITLTITQSPTVLPDTGIMAQAWVSDDADDPCLGTNHFNADPDTTLYFCLEVENTGASALTDVTVRSREVRLDVGSFELVQGGFDRIEPGELLVAVLAEPVEDGRMAGRVATRGLEINLEVEAAPVDSSGELLQEVSASAWVHVDVDPDESLPGFRDSISDGAGFLRSLGGVAVVAIGVLIPFLPFVAVIIALVWWRRRRRRARRQASPPPPPPADPA